MVRTRRPLLTGAALAMVLALLVAPGCARKLRAERDGKDAGDALCDLRDADSAEEAADALNDFENELSDLGGKYATFTAEDRADIEENLSDLREHVEGGNDELAQQDLAVIQRSLDNIKDDVDDTSEAAIDGFLQGLDDCISD